ncbi:helix-turn-helix domain-containing protein [Photobacterium damselae]|uniref:helix-turn-helix domain-containing protein n=1 Tax=Photobacterium damselae TaxID=38293 RepID=UPI004067CA41
MTLKNTENCALPDMHSADIIAALRKKKLSLRKLSVMHGLAPGTLNNAMARHWPKGELIIAKAVDMEPCDIWPSRYLED